jgi:Tfp pilus assembly protein PilF
MESKIKDSPNWFIDQLTLYQAANSSSEAVKQNFLIRIAEFELIIADLRNKKTQDPLQHELVLGRRGSGKSTLLRRIQIEVDEDKDLSKKYIAINLAEEQAGIYRLSDLWFEVLQELMIRFNAPKKLDDFSSFKDNQAYTRYLYAEIHQLLKINKKKVVLLLDNIDRILENFDDDAHLMREMLLNHNDLQIVGGSTRMDEHFWQYDKPFYEFFRRHRLEGLSFNEIHLLLNHWSDAMKLPLLKDYALQNRGKIEAIRIFTDGLPRALQYFIQILLHDSTLYGFDYLRKIMDNATPLYQERLNNLTPPQRKIVIEMAFWWEAAPTKILVEKTRMEGKLISSYIKQLESFGIVETLKTDTKNHLYRVAERFFNMWLIVTQGNPEQKRHAKYLTQFLEMFYDGHELKRLTLEHIENLKSGGVSYDKAMVLSKAFSQSKFIGVSERDELIDYTLKMNESGFFNDELPRRFQDIIKEVMNLSQEKKYEEALLKIDEIENEEDGVKFHLKAYCYQRQNKQDLAEKYYILAIDKGYNDSLNNLGALYLNQCKFELAEKYYLLAIEKEVVCAFNNLAILYAKQDKNELAEKYYLLAIEKGDIDSLYSLANLYYNQDKDELAEKYYLLAIEKGKTSALNNLAELYYYHDKNELAEKYFLEAIDKKNVDALINIALLYHDLNKNKEDAINYASQFYQNECKGKIIVSNIILEIWNGIFENIDKKIEQLFKESNYENLEWFLENLLYHEQKQLVLSLFESEVHGKELKSRYELIYYATLILMGKTEGNLLLKIPPEVMPTVEAIVEEVKTKQAFYATSE